MKIGFVGLGKMGLNMVHRLCKENHEIVAFDINKKARDAASNIGAETTDSIHSIIDKLPQQKIIWVMVPSGEITEQTLTEIASNLTEGDILIDGGNSNFKDSQRRAEMFKKKKVAFLDIGTSGGVWGLEKGYCLMAGGEKKSYEQIEPILKTLAPSNGYLYCGPSGSGHYVKMVHNGIEYAMLQAYAEGFELLFAKKEFNLDLNKISTLWNQGSVVRSWLLELAENAFQKDAKLETIEGYVNDSGEGRWTIENAIELDVPAPTIALALFERFRSRQADSFGNKFIAALRNEFGGHEIFKK